MCVMYPMPKYSFERFQRINRIQREDLIRDIERLYAREFDNQSERKKRIKSAILREPETISDVVREAKRELLDQEEEENGQPRRAVRFQDQSADPFGGRYYQGRELSEIKDSKNVGGSRLPGGGQQSRRQINIPNVGLYVGDLLNDRPHGKGRLEFLNKDIYEGDFGHGKREGFGILLTYGGEKYQGHWTEDTMNGVGNYYEADGSVYEGEYLGGLREGQGKYTLPDGTCFTGTFANNLFDIGELRFSDGRIYNGEWKDGLMHGNGLYVDKDGSAYKGNFFKGKKQGFGEMAYVDGRSYKGNWKNDLKDGNGMMVNADGQTTQGTWTNDQIVGKPTVTN